MDLENEQQSFLSSIGREVKMAQSTSGHKFSAEEVTQLREQFDSIDADGSGYIEPGELKAALDVCGFKIPQYQVRQMIAEVNVNDPTGDGRLSFDQFEVLCDGLKSKDVATTFQQVVAKRENLKTLGGMSEASTEGTTHSVRLEEQLAFSGWTNTNLGADSSLQHVLPIDKEGIGLYDSIKDGILLCKLINFSCPDTIDERAINMKNLTVYSKLENLTLAICSAQAIGCNITNIDAHDLYKGKPHLVLGVLWQIIRSGLFSQISLEHCPGLTSLLFEGESIEDLMKLSPEAILLRWVNHQLERAGISRRCTNLTSDITDSEVYCHLLKQIAPSSANISLEALKDTNRVSRAETMLQQADKLGCRSFVTAFDVVNGIPKLNLAFVANLFNKHPSLHSEFPAIEGKIEETHEERTYRNWMNSLGVSPYVNWLYSDLVDGLIIFELYDIIQPGIVDWKQVTRKFSRLGRFMEELQNCNYAVELGRKVKFSLVGIAGKDIQDGNRTLTLALIWQLMRAYTLSILSQLTNTGKPIAEKEIIDWSNTKLRQANKSTKITSFQDSGIRDGRVVIDLIDSIKPGTINYDLVKTTGSKNGNLANAKYAISMARKIGARVYALPEDITEVRMKMVMTVFATLMATDYVPMTIGETEAQ